MSERRPRVAMVTPYFLPHNGGVEQQEQESDTSRQDIVGGSPTSAFPATGALTRWGGVHCTGTLIEPRKVVTAAHCLEGVSASSLSFVIGPSLSSAQSVIKVVGVTPHPAYDSYSLENDIGYVTLAQDAPVQPMGIVSKMDSSWVGRNLVFVGYGNTNGNGTGSGTKRSVTMPISQVYATRFRYQTPSKNTCHGDSGGPAFAQVGGTYLVAGVTSYGDPYCTQYGVDTRVDAYASFLNVATLPPPPPPPPPSDPCNGETYVGRCDGQSVVWCENNQVHQQNCASTGEICGFSSANGYYECLPNDPCKGETFVGRCEGNQVIWCENQQVKTLNCNACGYAPQKGYYDCL